MQFFIPYGPLTVILLRQWSVTRDLLSSTIVVKDDSVFTLDEGIERLGESITQVGSLNLLSSRIAGKIHKDITGSID